MQFDYYRSHLLQDDTANLDNISVPTNNKYKRAATGNYNCQGPGFEKCDNHNSTGATEFTETFQGKHGGGHSELYPNYSFWG